MTVPRVPIAAIAGLVFLGCWIAASLVLADFVKAWNEAARFVYFAVAGFVWVFPIRWLMLWAARQR